MDRIIGIDYGRKRVGVAVSDPLGIFASALDTVPAAKIIEYIKNYAQKETITRFVPSDDYQSAGNGGNDHPERVCRSGGIRVEQSGAARRRSTTMPDQSATTK